MAPNQRLGGEAKACTRLGVSPQRRTCFSVHVDTSGKRDRKGRDNREPTLDEAESGEGRCGYAPYPDSQRATPNRRLEDSVHIGYVRSHKTHCRVGRESRVKIDRGDRVVAMQHNWVAT